MTPEEIAAKLTHFDADEPGGDPVADLPPEIWRGATEDSVRGLLGKTTVGVVFSGEVTESTGTHIDDIGLSEQEKTRDEAKVTSLRLRPPARRTPVTMRDILGDEEIARIRKENERQKIENAKRLRASRTRKRPGPPTLFK